jgi:ubiquinone/menaquinone biosynthesis C-methylase UbiE
MSDTTHQERILDQFTRQATPFSTASPITDANALRMIVEAADPQPGDTVLDVACGGGLVVCAFAPHVKHATGIDMTPAMLDRAQQLAAEKGIANVTWDRGDVGRLPYDDGGFDIVVTRFSMHHFLDPLSVMREMARVCAPGGRVVVVDMYAADDPAKAAEWNRAEKLRDPSHVRCLTLPEPVGQVVSEPRRRREDHRDVRCLGRGRPARHPGAARRRAHRLRLPDRDTCLDCHRARLTAAAPPPISRDRPA